MRTYILILICFLAGCESQHSIVVVDKYWEKSIVVEYLDTKIHTGEHLPYDTVKVKETSGFEYRYNFMEDEWGFEYVTTYEYRKWAFKKKYTAFGKDNPHLPEIPPLGPEERTKAFDTFKITDQNLKVFQCDEQEFLSLELTKPYVLTSWGSDVRAVSPLLAESPDSFDF